MATQAPCTEIKDEVTQDALPHLRLSARQAQILLYASNGYSAPETACSLGISKQTVRHTLQRTREKLEARNTAHAVKIALMENII